MRVIKITLLIGIGVVLWLRGLDWLTRLGDCQGIPLSWFSVAIYSLPWSWLARRGRPDPRDSDDGGRRGAWSTPLRLLREPTHAGRPVRDC